MTSERSVSRIPSSTNPGPLSPEERETIKTHPVIGWRMAEPLAPTLKGALEVIRHHHEKLDGSGYPDGLKDGEISAVARIMAVADIYDALVTDRPYRSGMAKEEALATIRQEAAQGLIDAAIVSLLVTLICREEELKATKEPRLQAPSE